MATNMVSPGVFVIEKDISEYAPSLNSSVVGIVGFASKGPVNEATLITSPNQLIRTFGKPSDDLPGQGLLGAVEILETTNSLYFVRGASTSAANATTLVPLGSCPTMKFVAGSYGVSADLYLKIQVKDVNGVNQYLTPKEIAIPAGTGVTQGQAMLAAIGGAVDSDKFGYDFDSGSSSTGYIYGSWAGNLASISVSAYSDSTFSTGLAVLKPVDASGRAQTVATSSNTAYGITYFDSGLSGVSYYVQSLYPGAGYNIDTDSQGNTIGNSISVRTLGNSKTIVQVNEDGTKREQFKVDLLDSSIFIEDVINTGSQNAVSEVIMGGLTMHGFDITPGKISSFTLGNGGIFGVNTIGGTMNGSAVLCSGAICVKLVEGTYDLAGGDNGVSNSDDVNSATLIGDPTATPKTGIYALDDDNLNISVALVPGMNNSNLQNALITLAEDSQNFIALVSPPYASVNTVQEAIEWSNGRSETRTTAINSSYAAVFWPWLQVFNVFTAADQWYDPTIYAARQMCFTDSAAETWFAPAGFQRGRLTKPTAVDVILNQGDRDSLYSGGNIINPIVSFPTQGITIFGQRTAQREPSALDRINVRRLMIYLRKVVLAASQRFVFEPNDPITWEAIQNVIDPLLDDIRRRRGITDYKVVCDETTNTPERIDRNELWCKVLLKPTKAAEIIVFEINVTNQSAKLGS